MSRAVKGLLQMALAMGLAVVAGMLMLKWMQSRPVQAPVVVDSEWNMTSVVVAKAPLHRGKRISVSDLDFAPFPDKSLPSSYFTNKNDLAGRVLIQTVDANELLTESKLAVRNATGVSALVTPGKRAMAVKGNKVLGIAGFIHPGDHVDVLATIQKSGKGPSLINDEHVAKLVLSNILVLATGEELDISDNGKTAPVDIYTLEVTPEESERLALAATQGELHFALRNTSDQADVYTKGADQTNILSVYRPVSKKAPKKSKKPSVTLIVGSEITQVTF